MESFYDSIITNENSGSEGEILEKKKIFFEAVYHVYLKTNRWPGGKKVCLQFLLNYFNTKVLQLHMFPQKKKLIGKELLLIQCNVGQA